MYRALLQILLSFGLFTRGHSDYQPSTGELELLAGQHVIYSYNTSEPPDELIKLTRAGLVGGVLLYDQHITSKTPAAMGKLLAAYRESPARHLLRRTTGKDTSLLIMTNQEGGELFRPIKDHGPYKTAKAVGLSQNPGAAGSQAGKEAADALKAYNINVNLAPVLGVFRDPKNFLDFYERSYGNTSEQVISAAMPFIRAQRARGILVSIKHFPGLGAAKLEQNTDEAPVTLNVPLQQLRTVDTATFAAAIRAGADIVMPSWAIYPAVDDKMPAGLSEKWMKGELRGRLGFRGVTITEAMEAGSILPFGDIATRAKLAFQAGNDLILASQLNVTEGSEVRQTLARAVQRGSIDRQEFDASTRRIAELRSRAWN